MDDSRFFLSDRGATDPEAELEATLQALFNKDDLGDQHAQCRFPARLDWLRKQLNIDATWLPVINCPLFDQWRELIHAGSVVLVFPAHHLNNPSSMFGHTLLRLDPRPDREQVDWLSYGVNFGANVPAGENSILYAYRGLSGGYPGQFIVEPYFKKIQEYNRSENRDIWEYPLNLSADETDRLVTHLWELKEINFDYFFVTENCSLRLLELLEVARPGVELTDQFSLTAIPIDTVRAVERGGLIAATKYRPAMATRLKQQLSTLPAALRPLLKQLADDPDAVAGELTQLAPQLQFKVLDTSYNGLRYQSAQKPRDDSVARRSHALLSKLSELPSIKSETVPTPTPPQKGHQSRRIAVTAGRDDNRNYQQIEARVAYHDLLDNSYGFLSGAQINMANVAVRHYEGGSLKLERFDVADIFSLTPRDTFIEKLSWRVYGGLERVETDAGRPLALHVTGGGGYGFAVGSSTLFALLAGRLEHNRDFDEPVEAAIGPQAGWLYATSTGNGMISASALQFSGGEQRINFGIEQNAVLALNHALRISLKRRWYDQAGPAIELALGYQWYFR